MRLNSGEGYAKYNVTHLKFQNLDQSSFRSVGYLDLSIADNHEVTSQLIHLILFKADSNAAIPMHFKSYKSFRVTRSILSE